MRTTLLALIAAASLFVTSHAEARRHHHHHHHRHYAHGTCHSQGCFNRNPLGFREGGRPAMAR